MKRRIILASILAISAMLGIVSLVFAVTGDVTNLRAVPTATTMSFTWTVAPSSTTTVMRYSTSSYPATPADGTAVSGSPVSTPLNHIIQSGLTAGTTYFYSVWGYDGADYSVTVAHITMTTLATDGAISGGDTMPALPNQPSSWFQAPDPTKLSKFEPFYTLINNFVSDWQAPAATGWLGFALMFTVALGVLSYIKFKEIFLSLGISEGTLLFFVVIGLAPGWMLVAPIMIGMGVWGIERSFQ